MQRRTEKNNGHGITGVELIENSNDHRMWENNINSDSHPPSTPQPASKKERRMMKMHSRTATSLRIRIIGREDGNDGGRGGE